MINRNSFLSTYLKRFIVFTMVSVSMLFATSAASACDAIIKISDAYVPEAPPSVKVMTAYMNLANHTEQAQIITRIESPQFKRIEMHETVEKDGVSRMQSLSAITIEKDQPFSLKPGGAHLMMFNPISALKENDEVELTLYFQSGEAQSMSLPVQKRKVMDHSHDHKNMHKHHNH